ncbi:YibE/F family protein [Candidatus Peregrinibacteria bacterium]|nr:YibE/F family protein [Candidatus Peregrinibacteria bacterium]
MRKKPIGSHSLVTFAVLVASLVMVVWPGALGGMPKRADSNAIQGKVLRVVEETVAPEGEIEYLGSSKVQRLSVGLIENGKRRVVSVRNEFSPVAKGDTLYLEPILDGGQDETFSVVGVSKSRGLALLALLFASMVVLVSGWKGIRALVGLLFSLGIIFSLVIPAILQGHNAIGVSLIGSIVILVVSFYVSYGFNRKMLAAIIGISLSLLVVGILAQLSVHSLGFSGFSSDESAFLKQDLGSGIDLVSLLIAGIMIAAIGVLDDVAITQASTVFALKSANPKLGGVELYRKAMGVGGDHISAVINTLVLAYAGAAMPLMLLLSMNGGVQMGYAVSIEAVAEEVVRTLVSSIGIVLGVPLTTAVAVLMAREGEGDCGPMGCQGHSHSY